MKFSKIISVGLMLAMAGMLMVSAPAARAQSTADLNAQIQALLAQIAQLQAQMNGGTTGGSTSCTAFSRSLTIGSTGSDVRSLQVFLNGHGAVISSAGAGAPGSESTYFGAKTKAALAKFQAANGISPAVGYFGPITMAKVNSMCTSTGGGSTGGGGVPVPGAGLRLQLSSQNPGASSLISGTTSAARVPVLAIDFTAGTASGVTVSDVSFMKNGVLSDSSISGAYLVENGKVLAQYNSITAGKVNFSNLGLNIAAGQTRTLWLAIDPASGLSAGNTVSFSLASVSDVKAWDANNAALTPMGTLPASGNIFTVTSVSNPSLATLTVASSSIGTEVTAGTNDNVVGAWNFTVGNSKSWLRSINFKVIGSANKNDLRNVKLYVNGVQVGSALSSVAADGTAYFDLASAAVSLNTGANSVQVHADIAGSPSYNFQFEILNSYDILVVDSQYNVPITAASNTGTQVSIKTGSITLQQASDTPTGNVAAGQSGVTLAKFTFYAAGEAVKIKWLGWGLDFTNASSQLSIDSQFKNISLVDDAGGQLGNTVNTLSTAVTCTDTTQAVSTSSYRGCFGSSGSPINYIVPANTTRTLFLRGDIQSTAAFGSVVGKITANTSNLQGLTSSQTASTGAANGAARTLASSAFTVSKNSAVGTQTFTPSSLNRRIGSYVLAASSAEGVNVSTVTILTGAAGAMFQNLVVKINGTQFGSTQSTLSNSTSYTFSGTQFSVPMGGSVTLDVYADVLGTATAGTKTAITTLSGCSANGMTSLSSISCTSTAGQDALIAGQATLTLSNVALPSNQVVMGTTGATLASFAFQETSNVEDVQVTELNIFQLTANTSTYNYGFSDFKLWNGGTAVGTWDGTTSIAASSSNGRGFYRKFRFSGDLVVPRQGSVTLVLKGTVGDLGNSNALDNTTHVFKIATSTDTDNDTVAEVVIARGNSSLASSSVSGVPTSGAPTKTVLRSKLTFASTATNANLVRQVGTELARLTFTPSTGGSGSINSITITFSGNAASSATFLDGITLIDNDTQNDVAGGNVTSTACTATTSCTKSFTIGAGVDGLDVTAGSAKTLLLRYDGTKLQGQVASVTMNLSASIAALGHIVYTDDRIDASAATGITLPSDISVPFSVGYHAGP